MACTATFKCATVGCYSCDSPQTNALFQRLQTLINQFAQAVAMPPVKVDGILGAGTTEMALVVLGYIGDSDSGVVGASAKGLEDGINGPEQLAGSAQAVVDVLTLATRQSAVASQATAPAPLPVAASQPAPTALQILASGANKPNTTTSAATQQRLTNLRLNPNKSGITASAFAKLPPWASYVGGALLALGALFAVFRATRKKKALPAPTETAGWRY